MQYEKWMEKITANDMPNEDLKYIAQNAGLKMALMLIFLLPGLSIYIPKLALKKLKEHYIMTEYDGTRTTLNRLAIECDYSQRYVYKIIRKNLRKKSPTS
ncbi:hypothetical protein J6O48_09510 [bacterium]|nr:hypothetical protein [bacterium]